jgi:hypothetical protein
MMLQHHYGHHLFGDDLAQGARLSVHVHRRHGHQPLHRLKEQISEIATEVKEELSEVEDSLMHYRQKSEHQPQCLSLGLSANTASYTAVFQAHMILPRNTWLVQHLCQNWFHCINQRSVVFLFGRVQKG